MLTFSVCMILGVLVGIASFSKSTLYLRNFTLPDGASRIDSSRSFYLLPLHSSTECAVYAYQMEKTPFFV